MHVLSGGPVIEERAAAGTACTAPAADVTVGEIAALKANVAKLEAEVSELRTMMDKLYAELGVSRS
jgi:uncharacterized protein YceH (UPF0502 family)